MTKDIKKGLPKGWEVKTLDKCANVISGYSFKSGDFSNDNKIKSIKITNVGVSEFIENNIDLLPQNFLQLYSNFIANENDIVVSLTRSIINAGLKVSRVSKNYDNSLVNQRVALLKNNEKTSIDYIYFFLNTRTVLDYVLEFSKSLNQPNLSINALKKLQIPLPPLPEQQRIVNKLDALFSRIDEAISLVEATLEAIPKLKMASLDKAFKGQLLSEVELGKNGFPKGWEVKELNKVVDFIGGSQPPKSKFSFEKKEGYVRLIQIRDYKSDNHIVYIKEDSTKKFCETDDIMVGRYGPPVFQILRGIKGAYNVALMKAIPNENKISKDFLFLFLQNPSIQNYIISISQRSAGQSGVNKKALDKYDIALPPLPEQQRIVNQLDELFKNLEALQSEYANKKQHLVDLKSSLLDVAFKGGL
jgi:type I restriction enzyme, S subunit